MKDRIAQILFTLALVALIALAVRQYEAPVDTGPDAKDAATLHQLFDDEWQARLRNDPLFASGQGDHRYDDRMPDASAGAHTRAGAEDAVFMERLAAIDRAALSEEDQLNYDLFQFVISNRLGVARFKNWRIPMLSDYGFHNGIIRMYEDMPMASVADYENYIHRLEGVADYFAQNMANMRLGLADGFVMQRAIMDNIVPSIAAHIVDDPADSAFYAPFLAMPETIAMADQARLMAAAKAAIAAGVVPAYRNFHAFFTGEYMAAARETLGATDLPDGDAYYRNRVRYYTTLNITPEDVHQLGLAEVARIRGEMQAIIDQLGFDGSFDEFLTFLRTDPRFYVTEPEQLLKEASWIAKKIDAQLPKLFGTLPRMPYGVRAVPDDIAANYTTGRYWGASPGADRGGLYMVNTYALDKRPLYVLPSLTLHEAVPGHHLQIALSAEMEGVPKFRNALYPHAYGEGWGLYAEKLGLEMGLYDDPYANFGRLTYEMWRAGRLVVDTGIHAFGWSRNEAVDLFVRNSALSLHNINTEVDRYIAWPGQALAYKMGELTFLRLRERAEERLGDRFDIRRFHDAVMADGGLPMTILETRVDAWIDGEMGE